MDDMVIPISDECPLRLIDRCVEAANILKQVAAELCFVIQCGAGKTELILALRGQGRMAAIEQLRQ